VWRAAARVASTQHNEPIGDVYLGTMSARLRRPHVRRIGIAAAIVVPVAGWASSLGGGFIIVAGPRGEGCRLFWGESVDRVAWSPSAEFLAITTTNADGLDSGDESVRVFRWPAMELLSFAILSDYNIHFTIDDAGVAGWCADSMSMPPAPLTPWQLDPGGVPALADAVVASRPSSKLRGSIDVSRTGIRATAIAPSADQPARLCIEDPEG
jgi:hypothetical protein